MISSKVSRLKERAALLKASRDFFSARSITEVDCPILSSLASVDTHIDLITAVYKGKEIRYLHSSPEMGMKRLLAEGMGDIYQLSHVFRDGELSWKHNPEFTLVEWYRLDFSLEEMIEETVQYIRLFLNLDTAVQEDKAIQDFENDLPYTIISYRDIFLKETGIDYVTATDQGLFDYIQKEKIPFYPTVFDEGKDALLNLILGSKIEPKLGFHALTLETAVQENEMIQDLESEGKNEPEHITKLVRAQAQFLPYGSRDCIISSPSTAVSRLTVLAYYPSSQAALARKRLINDEEVAERFEIYYQGIELANGFRELTDAKEQRLRFNEANEARMALGKEPLPLDENFIKALEKGLPNCSGVAVGFDRLMMLRQGRNQIADVISLGWEEA